MIERYSRPRMKEIWSEKNKFDQWLKVEIAACEAWAELGKIPQEVMPKIRKANCNLERMAEIPWRRIPLHPSWTYLLRYYGHRSKSSATRSY